MQNKKNEARKLISKPHGGRQKCVCENVGLRSSPTLQHGHYMWIHPGINIGLFIQESANKSTCCLLSKGIFS